MADVEWTNPQSLRIRVNEILALTLNTTNYLGAGESATVPVCTVTDLETGETVAAILSGVASVATPTISQTITGAGAVKGRQYLLEWKFSAGSNTWRPVTLLVCAQR